MKKKCSIALCLLLLFNSISVNSLYAKSSENRNGDVAQQTIEKYTNDKKESFDTLYQYYINDHVPEPESVCQPEDVTSIEVASINDNILWELSDDGTLLIKGSGDMPDYDQGTAPWYSVKNNIDRIIISEGITSVGAYSFYMCDNVSEVEFPFGITQIAACAFYGCTGLKKLELPHSVTTLGRLTFGFCYALESVNLPDSIATWGGYGFYNCVNLKSINIPLGVDNVNAYMFYNCSSLEDISIPDNVTLICSAAFSGCSSLTSIDLPDDITIIWDNAFAWCSSLQTVHLPQNLNNLYQNAFMCCVSLLSIDLPDNISIIREGTFRYCSALNSIFISKNISTIENDVFSGCVGLESIEVSADNVYYSSVDGVLYDKYKTRLIKYPSARKASEYAPLISIDYINSGAFEYCSDLAKITLPTYITELPEGVFNYCSALKTIELSSKYRSFDPHTINYCIALKEILVDPKNSKYSSVDGILFSKDKTELIYYPGGRDTEYRIPWWCKVISNSAFEGNDNITKIYIPEGVTKIGSSAFYGCYELCSVEIPESVLEIGDNAFGDCYQLSEIRYSGSDSDWSNIAIGEGNDILLAEGTIEFDAKLTEAEANIIAEGTCGDNIKWSIDSLGTLSISGEGNMDDKISVDFWSDYSGQIKNIIINDGVTSIGRYAFCEQSSLKSVSIPESVTVIREGAFRHCPELSIIKLPGSLKTIGDFSFYNCDSITEIAIPDGVTSIGMYAFSECEKMRSIYIPESVTQIDTAAFSYCKELEAIELPSGLTVLAPALLAHCESIKEITIPEGITEISDVVFQQCKNLTDVKLPANIKKIGDSAFYECKKLKHINLSGNINSIGLNAFYDCNSIEDRVSFRYIDELSEGAFCGSSLTITDALIDCDIPDSAFSGCKIQNVVLTENIKKIGDYSFKSCKELKNIDIPESVRSLGAGAFEYSGLTMIEIPDTIESVGDSAFDGCESLTYALIGSGINHIGRRTFYGCINLEAVELSDSITEIGEEAFCNCKKLTSINLPEGIVNIGKQAFSNCDIDRLRIPDSVTSLGAGAFESGARHIIIGRGITEIPIYCFLAHGSYNKKVLSVYIPKNVKTIRDHAFGDEYSDQIIVNTFYEGTEDEWKSVNIEPWNNSLFSRTSFEKTEPITPTDYDINTINNKISVNYKGYGYVRFRIADENDEPLAGKRVEYYFKGHENATAIAEADEFGVLTLKTPQLVSNSGVPEIQELTAVLDGFGERTVKVIVNPATYSQTWNGIISANAGISAGIQYGGSAGPLELEAKLASIGASASVTKGISVTDSYSDGKRNLTLKSTGGINGSVNGSLGSSFSAKFSDKQISETENKAFSNLGVKLTPGQIAGDAGVGVSYDKSIFINNYDPANSDQRKKIGLFLLDSTSIGSSGNALVTLIGKISGSETDYIDEYGVNINTTIGTSASAGSIGIGKTSYAAAGLSDKAVLGYRIGISDDKIKTSTRISDKYDVKIGSLKPKLEAGPVSSSTSFSEWTESFLNNSVELSATQKGNKIQSVSISSVEKNDVDTWLFKTTTDTVNRKVTFNDEQADNLYYIDDDIAAFLYGDKVFFTSKQMGDSVNNALTSGYHADYSRNRSKESSVSIPVTIGLKALLGFDIGFTLTGKNSIGYGFESGIIGNDKMYLTSESTPDSRIDSQKLALGEILEEPIREIIKTVEEHLDEFKAAVKDGVQFVKAKVTGAASGLKCKIVSIKDYLGIQSQPMLCIADETASIASASSAVTVGAPYVIFMYDENDNELSTWDDKITLTLSYDEQDLTDAGINGEFGSELLKMYRWDNERQVYYCIGGKTDHASRSVSADITLPGQYILAFDNCPPLVTDFKVSDSTSTPEISAVISDISGIEDFEFKLDGVVKVDKQGFYEHYSVAESKFIYKVDSDLKTGEHTASISAADSSGNDMDEAQIIRFTVDRKAPMITNVSVPDKIYTGQAIVSLDVEDDNIDLVQLNMKYNDVSYHYIMEDSDGHYSYSLDGLPEYGYADIYIDAYDTAGNHSQSETFRIYFGSISDIRADMQILSAYKDDQNKLTINYTINCDAEISGQCYVALYDKYGKLAHIKLINVDVSKASNHTTEFNINNSQPEPKYMKIFLWHDNMIPLCDCKRVLIDNK